MKKRVIGKEKKMRGCTCLLPLVGLLLVLGTANTAMAQTGACCLPDAIVTCDRLTQADCEKESGGQYQGDGTNCIGVGPGSTQVFCPDCDCDGVNDVREIADCVAACCVAIGGCTTQTKLDGCNSACTEDGNKKLPNDCNSDLTQGFCCEQATGINRTLCQGDLCYNDTCSGGTFGKGPQKTPIKVCQLDFGHGFPVHTPDDGWCRENFGGWTCSVDMDPCGSKDSFCVDRCDQDLSVCGFFGFGAVCRPLMGFDQGFGFLRFERSAEPSLLGLHRQELVTN